MSQEYTFKLKENYNSIIPLKIYQTWHTKNLPKHMNDTVELLKNTNPEFEHFLFDDNDCRNFIKNNFNEKVLHTFNKLKPGAYKADLWRYCVLYINGGVYLDIKFKCVNGFKLIALTEKERFPTDVRIGAYPTEHNKGVYNGFMMSLPRNKKLLNAIQQIVLNVSLKYYGKSPLDITGPIMLGKLFPYEYKKNSKVRRYSGNQGNGVSLCGVIILDEYQEYRSEQNNVQGNSHYWQAWDNKDIFN
jgi:mannosyltransferase OCH1-like enzyme